MENGTEIKYWKIIAVLIAIAGPSLGWVLSSNSALVKVELLANANAKELENRRDLVDSIPVLIEKMGYIKEQADKNSHKLDNILYEIKNNR